MAKKYLLFETVSEWESANQQAENELGIPLRNTLRYADRHTIDNPDHADYGKHILPVTEEVANLFSNQSLLSNPDGEWYTDPDGI
tara:strand:- start:5600 stop:5854 length:255 start_codon:yes stop_codon:yes gene_type:complete